MVLDTRAIRNTVQEFEPTEQAKAGVASYGWVYRQRQDLLPPYGTRDCDLVLRRIYRMVHNTLTQSAITGFIKKIVGTPWEIKGGRNLAKRYTEMFQQGQFGQGWAAMLYPLLTDYCTQNFGGVMEVIAPGDPTRPVKFTNYVGFAHLDSLRCAPTGNPEYPVVYQSRRTGKLHALHATRVIRFVDMPDPDEFLYGSGMSALYRMISVSNVLILMQKYQTEKLNDLPPSGFMTIKGMSDTQVTQAMANFEADRQADGQSVFRNLVKLGGMYAEQDVKVEITPFSSLPEQFDYKTYMEDSARQIAAALGIGIVEFWEIVGGGIGTATQTDVIARQGKDKGYAAVYRMLERAFNRYLPPDLEFRFKYRDQEADKEQAERAKFWMDIAKTADGLLSREQQLELLANNVEAFADVVLDEDGQIKLPDNDVLPDGEQPEVITDSETSTAEQLDEPSTETFQREYSVRKDWNSTVKSFTRDFTDLIQAGNTDEMARRRFGTVARAQLRNYGTQAYRDGLAVGGVEVEALDNEALNAVAGWLADQSEYVTNFANEVYAKGLSDAQVVTRAELWANKSLRDVFNLGLQDSEGNGAFKFELGRTEQHCTDCLRLSGQVHRLKAWLKEGMIPKSNKLKCGGWRCDCQLKRTRGRSRGNF